MLADTTLLKENTALKQQVRELQAAASSQRFQTIFEYSRLANKLIAPNLQIIEANPALVTLLGYNQKEEIIGTRILDYSPAVHHAHWKTLQKNLWENKIPFFILETSLIKKGQISNLVPGNLHSIPGPAGTAGLYHYRGHYQTTPASAA